MKKAFCLILCAIYIFSMSGCGSFFVDEEYEIYSETVDTLLTALENQDADAIYNLFSPAVRREDEDLKEKIQELLSIYDGPTEQIGDISCLAGGASYEDGMRSKDCGTRFPIFSDGKYYWIDMELMYVNTFDKSQVGVTCLEFFSAEAFYELWSYPGEYTQPPKGLNLYIKDVAEYNIVSINNYPFNIIHTNTVDLDEVRTFFETSTSTDAFVAQFGEPSASCEEHTTLIYCLPTQDGEERYLDIGHADGQIYACGIYGNFGYIDTVFEEE